jgi:hypothetical protein
VAAAVKAVLSKMAVASIIANIFFTRFIISTPHIFLVTKLLQRA